MGLNGPVTSKDRWAEGDLVARFPGWTVRIQAPAVIAADGILGAGMVTILGALHRSVTRTAGPLAQPRTGHGTGTYRFDDHVVSYNMGKLSILVL